MTLFVRSFIDALDSEMRRPSSPERGKRIAYLSNQLDLSNDRLRFFDLGIDYRKDRKPKVEEAVLVAAAGRTS